MNRIYRRCAGLDIHKKSISACVRIQPRGQQEPEIHEAVFGTFTAELENLRSWLKQHKVKHIAMESTGVYWIPVWNVLEAECWRFHLLLVNPARVRAIRGHKTDRIDAARIAEYLQEGRLSGSFVPSPRMRQWRDMTRLRVHLQQDRNRVINRIGGLLEKANLKLGSVASNIVGKTGRAILEAIAQGRSKPEYLANLAVGSLRHKKAELLQALNGRYTEHFRWMLQQLLGELRWLDGRIAELDARISDALQPHADLIRRLCTIPGVSRLTAWTLIAEIGTDLSEFPDAAHLSSWAGLSPGNEESAGKRKSGATSKGDRYLRRLLVQDAWAVSHKENCYLTAVFYRTAHRRGLKKAAVAVAHRILVIAYHIIRDGTEYRERGGDYFDRKDPARTALRLTRRLERIGFDVVLSPRTSATVMPKATSEQTSPTPSKRRRGRPCKCQERGIPCTHATPTSDCRLPAIPDHCPRCHKWGIPCIHVRKHILHNDSPQDPSDTST